MSFPQKVFAAAMLFLYCVPGVSIAATTTVTQSQITQLQQELTQLQAEVDSLEASSTPIITTTMSSLLLVLPYGQSSTESGGGLRITFSGIGQLNASPLIAATSTLAQPFGIFNLNYTGCANEACNSTAYPTQTTELWPGRSTGYLNYNITLDSLGTSTAVLSVTKQ